MSTKEKTHSSPETAEKQEKQRQLVLYNDDVNTFDFVIDTLIEVCDHDPLQAENCVFIAHFKGKCPVKNGSYKELLPCYNEMIRRQLTVEIK